MASPALSLEILARLWAANRQQLQMVILYKQNKWVPAQDENGHPQVFRIDPGRGQEVFYTLHPDVLPDFTHAVRAAGLTLEELATGSGPEPYPPAPSQQP